MKKLTTFLMPMMGAIVLNSRREDQKLDVVRILLE